ncbi:hypothetical protein CRE_17426 [Caenorhabditis remanei]|uniref:F-box associated domain-containing protein n=1 Tax=Caenorhabditis remanei TaxID=31234 RepID=E3N1Z9_CAERE|nr:hypothetical protein CRE_17426 [Caenorhabditis remanei]
MERPISPRSKPLSYDALKSVIKSMSVEKRQELHNHLPSLRAVNSLLPYTIKDVRISETELKINRKKWFFDKNPETSNSPDDDSNQTTIWIVDRDTYKNSPVFHVNKSPDEAFENFFNVYFKNGSTIQCFILNHVPQFLCERDGSDGFKLSISRLETNNPIVDKFDSFIRFVNLDNLEYIHLSIDDRLNEHGEQFGMLEKPAIINSKELDFHVWVSASLINYYTGLRNQTLLLNDNQFDVNELCMLIENWKTSDRPIGTSFCLYSYSYSNDRSNVFDSLELQGTFPVENRGDSADKPGIGIKMDDNRDLVVYKGFHQKNQITYPALKMEVIASGSEKKNGDSEPDVSG